MSISYRFAAIFAACLFASIALAAPVHAHVGSPDVFYEGDAGPYHLFVAVRVPQVIPGVADIQVRAGSDDVTQISTAVARLTGAGSKYAPIPDVATRSPTDPHFFTSNLWLMEYGSLRVVLNVKGARGDAQMSVPVASFARRTLAMPPALGALLLVLAGGLALGAVSIVGAAARDSNLAPGTQPTPEAIRRGRRAMLITAAFVAAIFYLAFAWWNSDARSFAETIQLFKPPPLTATLESGNRLVVRASSSDERWLKFKIMESLVPDHGHLMHLFLFRTPGLDRLWHLHPKQSGPGGFEETLPSVDAGEYQVFADVVGEGGFPWTLVGKIRLPQISGQALSGDDSAGSADPIRAPRDTNTDVLSDGTRVTWVHDKSTLRANNPMTLQFLVLDQNGNPATDLEPYMGMAAHAEIIRNDLSVFAHIHPSGTVPMAAIQMASAGSGEQPVPDMPGMAESKIAPLISMPYGFPQPGEYRIFFQFKRAGRIETASFDASVK